MNKRKPKPLFIYREETHAQDAINSTRQTFDEKQYKQWVENAKEFNEEDEIKFYIGSIEWKEDIWNK